MPHQLNHTAIVVLGMVASGCHNGWEITQTVGRSTNYFWTASRGGIYPELKKLRAAGLLDVADDAKGEVTRHNYTLTAAGSEAFDAWLLSDDVGLFEMRNEDLLRLFFAEELDPEQQTQLVSRMKTLHEQRAADLNDISRPSTEAGRASTKMLTLDYGIALHRAAAQWCADAEQRLLANRALATSSEMHK